MTSKRWIAGETLSHTHLNDLADIADQGVADAATAQSAADAAQADAAQGIADAATAQGAADAAQADADAAQADATQGIADAATAHAAADAVQAALDAVTTIYATSDDTSGAIDLIDPGMEVAVTIGNAGLSVGPTILGLDGTVTMTAATVEAATLGDLGVTAGDAAPGLDTIDPGMEVGEVLAADGTRDIGPLRLGQLPQDPALVLDDPGMESPFLVRSEGIVLSSLTVAASDAGPGLDFIDPGMEVAANFTASGATDGFGGTATTTHSEAEIGWRNAENLAAANAMATNPVTNVARSTCELNHFISYGQSLSIGSEGTPVLTTVATYDNLMYGDQVRPTTNNSATAVWDRVGASAFNGMVATGGTEVPIIGALNTFRRLYLASRGVPADSSIRFVASSAGIGGQDIAALSLGASPDIFQRVISVMSQAHGQATSDGASYGVTAMLWLQGESDQTRTSAYYLPLLRAIYADFKAAVAAETGQADPPAFFTYQTCAPNTNFDTAEMGVQMAQLTMALEDDGVFMIGPNYPYPDSNNLHLPANSYRWLGAQFGKVMHRVLVLGHRWKPLHMRRATRRGREVLVDFHVPVPPLVFEDPWLQDGWAIGETATGGTNTQYAVPDKGFSVRTTGGTNQTISTVALVSETQVLITLAADTAADLIVRYANGRENHFGHGSLRDSDPALADEIWLDGQPGQTDADTNAALSGARYPLYNWAVAGQIDVEVLS